MLEIQIYAMIPKFKSNLTKVAIIIMKVETFINSEAYLRK